MKRVLPILLVIVVIAAGLTYYIATKNSKVTYHTTSASTTTLPKQSVSASTTAQAAGKVTIKGMAFSPSSITVKKGTTVTWTNEDSVAHTVTETDSKAGPKSGSITKGESYSYTFANAGTYSYDCSIHPSMTGTVTVTE